MHDLNPDALRKAEEHATLRIGHAFDQFIDCYLNEVPADHRWLLKRRLERLQDDLVRRAMETPRAYLAAMAERVLPDILKWLPAEFTLKVEADRGDWVVITSPEHPGLYVATPRTDAVGAFSDVPVVLSHLIRLDAAAKEAPHD